MVDATRKHAYCFLGQTDINYDVVHRGGIKHRGGDAQSGLKSNGEDHRQLEDAQALLLARRGMGEDSEGA